jgi:hypothetical protein
LLLANPLLRNEFDLLEGATMGISMSVLMITDDQIRDFSQSPSRLEDLLNRTIPFVSKDLCYLADFWDGLHYVLTAGPDGAEVLLGVLKRGDVKYSKGLSDPAHAIYSATVRALAEELQGLSESRLRARFDPRKMLEACVYPGRMWVFPDLADDTFRDLMSYFRRLRDFATEATRENKGLVFCRYEDG